ncbi:murein hydrolase activator EnvC family protein [Govanella unica]|uniref:Peptidoglycan DD-metalloendopeptidase family protein n=1 Tax=Govanella unica TaxID=2975056 RepID=A0A9X3Z666_9PROT|nr:peptidoglycan DD-metalloendopeptidase family protein [Govania unica]MDA5192767.1 peptidoglycan DD-metalloendopeptidase family protein [Govania unica]
MSAALDPFKRPVAGLGARGGLTALGIALLLTPPVLAQQLPAQQEASRKKLEAVQDKITKSQEHQKELEAQKEAVSRELSDLQSKLVRAANSIQKTEEQTSGIEARVFELDDKFVAQNGKLNSRRGDIALTLAALGRVSRQPPQLVLLRPNAAIDTVRSAGLLSSIMPVLRSEAEDLKQDLVLLKQLKSELEDERKKLDQSLAGLEKEREDMDLLLAQRKREQRDIEKEASSEQEKMQRFGREAKSLENLIDNIEKEIARRQKAAEDAARKLAKRPGKGEDTKGKKAPSEPPAQFAKALGNLPLPVRGDFVRGYGDPDDTGAPSKGIVISARPGAQVISPADGRVLFAGPFRDYGQILIIAHGGSYHSLLAGLTKITAAVGQAVVAGEPVGQMGGDEGSTSPGARLYVELRNNGKPVNPMRWLAAGKGKVRG